MDLNIIILILGCVISFAIAIHSGVMYYKQKKVWENFKKDYYSSAFANYTYDPKAEKIKEKAEKALKKLERR